MKANQLVSSPITGLLVCLCFVVVAVGCLVWVFFLFVVLFFLCFVFKVKNPMFLISLSNGLKAFPIRAPTGNYNYTKIHRQQTLKDQCDVASSVCNTDYSKLCYKLTKIHTVHVFVPIIHLSFLLEKKNKVRPRNYYTQ